MSILPICDEFIVALGDCDQDDRTREEILSINDPKIKIIDTVWDIEKYSHGTEMAHQTDIAKSHCTGDWLFCIQADEIVHENDLAKIKDRCLQLFNNNEIDGILFKFIHFWADYEHHCDSHGWHKHEIRIIRNDRNIHSWKDSMSFRKIEDFDGIDYMKKEGTSKLRVALADATIYHYGWARPPEYMKTKIKAFTELVIGNQGVQDNTSFAHNNSLFDYGVVSKYPKFKDSHPTIMKKWIDNFYWKNQLQYSGSRNKLRKPHKQERLKYRFVTFLEKRVFFKPMWEFNNYILIKK